MASPIVDIHPHIISHDMEKYPLAPIGGKRSDWSAEHAVDAEHMITAMDEAGVDLAAMVHSSTTYGFDCSYLVDSVGVYPDRFTGVFSINVLEPDGPEKMRYWHSKGGSGMRIFSRGTTLKGAWLALDDERIFPCYEMAEELNITVSSNVTVDVFHQFEAAVKRFPKVKFVIEHLGKTDFTDGGTLEKAAPLWNFAQYSNLYLKIASRNFTEANDGNCTPEVLYSRLIKEFGANRMAWGSNYPASPGTLKELLDMAQKKVAFLSDEDKEWLFGRTAFEVLYPALQKVWKK